MTTIYISVRKMRMGRGECVASIWGEHGYPRWDDVPFLIQDKSGASFDVARKMVKQQIAESTGIPYRQLRCVGIF